MDPNSDVSKCLENTFLQKNVFYFRRSKKNSNRQDILQNLGLNPGKAQVSKILTFLHYGLYWGQTFLRCIFFFWVLQEETMWVRFRFVGWLFFFFVCMVINRILGSHLFFKRLWLLFLLLGSILVLSSGLQWVLIVLLRVKICGSPLKRKDTETLTDFLHHAFLAIKENLERAGNFWLFSHLNHVFLPL